MNIIVTKAFLEAQQGGDVEAALRDHALPNFSFIVPSKNNEALRTMIPGAGYAHHGREGYGRFVSLLLSEYEPLEFATSRFTDTGDQVFIEGHMVLRHRETAKIANSDFIARFEMRGGKIAAGQLYENSAAIAAARLAV